MKSKSTENKQHQKTTLNTRVVIFSNEVLKFVDNSGALPSRFICLKLTRSFLGQEDLDLTEKLLAERAGILNWSLDGLDRLRMRGVLLQPRSGADLAKQLSEMAQDLARFVEECCIIGPDLCTPVQQLFDRWRQWCSDTKLYVGWDISAFSAQLTQEFPELRRVRRNVDNKKTSLAGIKLRPWMRMP